MINQNLIRNFSSTQRIISDQYWSTTNDVMSSVVNFSLVLSLELFGNHVSTEGAHEKLCANYFKGEGWVDIHPAVLDIQ